MTALKTATLILEDGTQFKGFSFGADKSCSGEVVFNTGMTGYPESLTDPSYLGQIIVSTYPIVGNYGVPERATSEDTLSEYLESECIHPNAIVCQDYSFEFSHWQAATSLADWLKEEGVVGITGIDTRALTKILREKGSMLGKIVVEDCTDVDFYDPNQENLVAKASCKQVIEYGVGNAKTVVLVDCGVKHNIIRCLLNRGAHVIRVPWDYDFTAIEYDGLFISNGPGNPEDAKPVIELVRALRGKLPIFGICLGHQIIALAYGAATYKLKFGHRGGNHPVKNLRTGKIEITAQNHSYAVDAGSLTGTGLEVTHVNLLDNTVEGLRCEKDRVFSVQYHPESAPGPQDSAYLFDEFIRLMEEASCRKERI